MTMTMVKMMVMVMAKVLMMMMMQLENLLQEPALCQPDRALHSSAPHSDDGSGNGDDDFDNDDDTERFSWFVTPRHPGCALVMSLERVSLWADGTH